MSTPIEIDGSEGEGGGQILRSSLALSILTQQPFRLMNIRAKRPKPGLAAQHLASVRAAAAICNANVLGAKLGSSRLDFEPSELKSGDYRFEVTTAGATGLVLHTVYLPLALRGTGPSRITITGGTHVAFAPTFDYLNTTWAKHMQRCGVAVALELVRPGFYPRGGGEVRATISPTAAVLPVDLIQSPPITMAHGFATVADLPDSIAQEMARRIRVKLTDAGIESDIELRTQINGPAAVCGIEFRQLDVPAMFVALGERGKAAQAVADDAIFEAMRFCKSGCPVDSHGADQILLPLAFAAGPSSYRVAEITQHLLTNIATVQRFLTRSIRCEGNLGAVGTVHLD